MTIIVTKRLTLRKWARHDDSLRKMVRWLNDKDVVQFSEQRHKRHDEESQLQYIDNADIFREIHSSIGLIGTIAASVDKNNSVANIGILIGEKSQWGKGYGTEAWQAFCDHLLTHGIRKIEAGAMSVNYGMIYVFRKTGMKQEGRLKEHFILNNQLFDLVQWARFE